MYPQTLSDTAGFSYADQLARILHVVRRRIVQSQSISTYKRLPFKIAKFYWNDYVCLTLTAAIGLAVSLAFFKVLSENVSVFQAMAVRALFSSFVMLSTCYWKRISMIQPREKITLFIARGVVGSVSSACVFLSTFLLPLSDAAFLSNNSSAVTAVFSWILGLEQLSVRSWFGVLGCTIGNALVAKPPFLFGGNSEWSTERFIGIAAAIAGNIFVAGVSILLRYIGKSVNSLVPTAYTHICCLLLAIPFLAGGIPKPVNTQHFPLLLVSYAVVCSAGVFVQLILSRALQIGPPAKTSALLMMYMFFSGMIGIVFFSESISWVTGLGAAVIAISVILILTSGSDTKTVEERYQRLFITEDVELGS